MGYGGAYYDDVGVGVAAVQLHDAWLAMGGQKRSVCPYYMLLDYSASH